MSASRASRLAAALLGALLLSMGRADAGGSEPASQLAQAQGAPIQIVPLPPPHPNEGATPGAGAQPPAQAAPTAPAGGGAAPAQAGPPAGAAQVPASPKGIEVDKLAATGREAAGVLDARNGGLGAELWRGTPHALVEGLIQALPASIPSPALRELARRLLLTSATPPEGATGGGPDLLSLRAQKLAEMGDFEDLKALMAAAPGAAGEETLARIGVEARLLEGKTSAVCAEIGNLIRSYHSLYWQKVQVFCQALAKKNQEVDAGIDLLREEGDDKDGAYFTLIDAIMGNKSAKVTSLDAATPLALAMLRAAKQTLPEEAMRNAQPAVLRAIADGAEAGSDLGLVAAERAELQGALTGEALRRIYDGVKLSDAELQNALSQAQAEYGPRARVLLYRAAKTQTVPTARAEALRTALSLARSANLYELAVAVNLPAIEALAPSTELGFFASEAGRALVYAGEIDKAEGWFAVADADSRAAGSAANAATELWPYARLLASDADAKDNERLLGWRAAEKAKAGAEAKLVDERAARLLGLAAALGKPLQGAAWQSLYLASDAEPAAMPPLPLWQGLSAAVQDGRRGEAVLLALLAVGSAGVQNANPIALDAVIESLRRLGLDKDARRLAVEAAVGVGI